MTTVKVLADETVRYNGEYLKFDSGMIIELADDKLVDLLIQFGVAEKTTSPIKSKVEDKEVATSPIEVPLMDLIEAEEKLEAIQEAKKEKPPKKEGKKSIFFEAN